MRYTCIASLNLKKNIIQTNLLIFLTIPLVAYSAHLTGTPIIRFVAVIVIAVFSYHLVMSTKKEGFAAGFCMLLGCMTVISGLLISTDIPVMEKSVGRFQLFYDTVSKQVHHIYISKEFLHLYTLFTGVSCMALGMIFAYRPTLIQVKNFVPYEYPYPVWNQKDHSQTRFSTMIRTRDLLTYKERLSLCRFKYIVVLIHGRPYLVAPDEMIPDDSIIMRTKSGNTLCGISRF